MLTTDQVVDSYFLETRCMLVEIAATLDRFDHARDEGEAPADGDPRWDKLLQSLELLAQRQTTADRAERLLNLFSDLD